MDQLGFTALTEQNTDVLTIVVAALNAAQEKEIHLLVPLNFLVSHGVPNDDEEEEDDGETDETGPISSDFFIRNVVARLQDRVAPHVRVVTAAEGGVSEFEIYIHPQPVPSPSPLVLCKIAQPSSSLLDCAVSYARDLQKICPLPSSPQEAILVFVKTQQAPSNVYSLGVKYRFIASVTSREKGLWPDAISQVGVSSDWLLSTPVTKCIVHGHECADQILATIAALDQSASSPMTAMGVSPADQSVAPTTMVDRVPGVAATSNPSPTSTSLGSAIEPASVPLAIPPADHPAPLRKDCPCTSISLTGSNVQECANVEYKELKKSKSACDACYRRIRDNILPMMRSWHSGRLCVGITDKEHRCKPFALPRAMNAKTFVETIGRDLDQFLQGVFPPIPRDAQFNLCLLLVPSSTSSLYVLQFSYCYPTAAPEMLKSLLHPGTNAVSVIEEVPAVNAAAAPSIVLRRLHPMDVWLLARAGNGDDIPRRVKRLLAEVARPKLLLEFDGMASPPPVFRRVTIENSCRIAHPDSAGSAFEKMQTFDDLSRWTVVACCRTREETKLSWIALTSIPTNVVFDLVLVMNDFDGAKVIGRGDDLPSPILGALRSQRLSANLIDIVCTSTLVRQRYQALLEAPGTAAAACSACEESGIFVRLREGVDDGKEAAAINARAWLETGASIAWDVVQHDLVVCPQAALIMDDLVDHLNGCNRLPWLYTFDKIPSDSQLPVRSVGATTLLRVIGFRALAKVKDLVVLQLHHDIDPQRARDVLKMLKSISVARPLLVVDDEVNSDVLVQLLAKAPLPNFAYIRVLPRQQDSRPGSQKLDSRAEFSLSPLLDDLLDVERLCAVLSALYPQASASLARLRNQRGLHVFMFVLTAVLDRPVVKLEKWVSKIITALDTLSLRGTRVILAGLAFLCSFEDRHDGDSFAWVMRTRLNLDPTTLGAFVQNGCGILRRRGNFFCFFHPLLALEFLKQLFPATIPSSGPPLYLMEGLKGALTLHYDHANDLVSRLLITRAPGHQFSSLILFASSIRISHVELQPLCSIAVDRIDPRDCPQLLAAHLDVLRSRYVRCRLDKSFADYDRKTMYEAALFIAFDAYDQAVNALDLSSQDVDDEVPPAGLFIFLDTIAWAQVRLGDHDQANVNFRKLYEIAVRSTDDPKLESGKVLKKVNTAFHGLKELLDQWPEINALSHSGRDSGSEDAGEAPEDSDDYFQVSLFQDAHL